MSYTRYTRADMEFIAVNDLSPAELTVVEVGHGFAVKGRRTSNRARTFQLHIIADGEGIFDDKQVACGSGFLVRRGDYYSECGAVEQFWINFDGGEVERLLESVGIGIKTQIIELDSTAIRLILREFRAIFADDSRLTCTKYYMLGSLYRILSLFGRQPANDAECDVIERLKTYIGRNLSCELKLETLASQVGLSPKYLSRLFRAKAGQTLTSYIEVLRLSTASTLLISSNRTIDEIARAVGYRDPLYFSKVFKAHFGRPPSKWR